MSTFNQMIDHTLAEIQSYVKSQDSITVLTQPLTIDGYTMSVDDANAINKGTVEVGDELVYVKAVAKTTGQAQILTNGRGWRSTTAAAWSPGTLVRNNPLFPRSQVKRAIKETLNGLDFPVVSNYSFTFNGSTYAHVLPGGAEYVTGVSWQVPDSSGVWHPIRHFRLDRNFFVDDDPNPRVAIVLQESPMPGRQVRVQYVSRPSGSFGGDDEFTISGMPASAEDVIRLGAMWRLVSTIDPGKVTATTPQADLIDEPVASGSSQNVAKYLYQLFQVRLAEEKAKAQNSFQQIIHYARA